MRHRIGRAHIGGVLLDQIAIMIAAHCLPIQRYDALGHPGRVHRSRQHVAEIDDLIDFFALQVLDHGLKRQCVAMDVGDGGKAHQDASSRVNSISRSSSFSER
jgi:hypothetical protein